MMKVALETVGCRLNQYETEKIAAQLVGAGMQRVDYKDRADLYILNSCTVTGRADADCRKFINRARRQNKDAVIVVTGCYVVAQPDQIAELGVVDLAVGNDDKERLAEILRNKYPHLFLDNSGVNDEVSESVDKPPHKKAASAVLNRAKVKIGDGCDQCCSYCIVPSVRGRLVSLPSDEIIEDIRRQIANGYHEVVLTAVHIGKYQYDGMNLAGLVETILKETGLSRVRLSSLEPNELDQRLLELVADNPRVCRHFHLPLQSGSNRILKMMRRPYTREEYLATVEQVKKSNLDITVGCDLIVGFPGETDQDFKDSLELLESGYIDYAHVFSYSDRPGTAASDLPDKITIPVIKDRTRQAREIADSFRLRQMQSQIGKILGVISTHRTDGRNRYQGVSDNYLKVYMPKAVGGGKAIIKIKPSALVGDHLEGEVVPG